MPKKIGIVIVATNIELDNQVYRRRLTIAVQNTATGQRDWPTVIQDMLLYADMKGITIRYSFGKPFRIPLVDDVWNDNERYIREFLASTRCEYPDKDRLIDLYFRVMMPDVARHFSR